MIHLDTHVVVWLYQGAVGKLSRRAKAVLRQSNEFRVSPLVLMELDNLVEARRIKPPSVETMIAEISDDFGGLTQSLATLSAVVSKARGIGWTRDPFDRLIVANAMADGAKLLTADEKIRAHFKDAVWD